MTLNPLARTWLRRIALGLPLTGAAVLSGCWGSGCDTGGCPEVAQYYDVSPQQIEALANGSGTCREVCTDLQTATGLPDTRSPFVDDRGCPVGGPDGGDAMVIECHFVPPCPGGRPPAGLLASRGAQAHDALGAHLAEAARMELASVPAFHELARELYLHGAPRATITAASRSAHDEVRHARSMRRLARAVGATPAPVERAPTETRTMSEMLEDNAITGCTGEAHAALVAAHQAANAPTAALRAVFTEIARDEARHALLSYAIHDWAVARLPARRARALEETRRAATEALVAASDAHVHPTLTMALGVPSAERAVALAQAV